MTAHDSGQPRQRILRAAVRCIARTGFHGTPMEEIVRESGLSAEELRGHFADKAELMLAVEESILQRFSAFFQEIRETEPIPPLGEIIERFADTVIAITEPDNPGSVAPLYWGSAQYDQEIAGRVRQLFQQALSGWIEIAERERAAGELAPDADVRAIGNVLTCLLPGIIMLRRVRIGEIDGELFRRGVQNLADRPVKASGTS